MDSEDIRVESFSCYLDSSNDNFLVNLTGGIPDSSSTVTSPEGTPRVINLGRSKTNEPGIKVFGAEKYFSMKNDYSCPSKYGHEKERSVDLSHPERNLRPKTPSTSSGASSWNSQSSLLQTKHKRRLGMRFFPLFGCKGLCLEKKAVYINGSVDQPGLKKVDQFSFPVLSSGTENVKVKKQSEEAKVQDDPRNSIEVFGSVLPRKGHIAVNMERKLSILTWDAIPKSQSLVTTSFGSSAVCDDMASDASSDLFEIENISGTEGYSGLARQESCNMSPTTQYAPSEASIAWSVVTASAADFSSVVSDYEEKSASVKGDLISRRVAKPKDSGTKEAPKSGPSKLLGCRSTKAVRVAESTYRPNGKVKHEA